MPSAARRPLAIGNWKMHKSLAEARDWLAAAGPATGGLRCEVGVAAPYVHLTALATAARQHGLRLAGQNCHDQAQGAFTGEISAPMLLDAGADSVLLGHSERRRDFGESDALVGRKLGAAARVGLLSVVCVGESLAERQAGRTEEILARQVDGIFGTLPAGSITSARLALAYEPVWAIGTGLSATAAQAEAAIAFLRLRLAGALGSTMAAETRVLYGGSVTAGNAAEVLSGPSIDGALVGGASLDPGSFAAIALALERLA